jgi:hypothetical protein
MISSARITSSNTCNRSRINVAPDEVYALTDRIAIALIASIAFCLYAMLHQADASLPDVTIVRGGGILYERGELAAPLRCVDNSDQAAQIYFRGRHLVVPRFSLLEVNRLWPSVHKTFGAHAPTPLRSGWPSGTRSATFCRIKGWVCQRATHRSRRSGTTKASVTRSPG